jgi:hypothetical protein
MGLVSIATAESTFMAESAAVAEFVVIIELRESMSIIWS